MDFEERVVTEYRKIMVRRQIKNSESLKRAGLLFNMAKEIPKMGPMGILMAPGIIGDIKQSIKKLKAGFGNIFSGTFG